MEPNNRTMGGEMLRERRKAAGLTVPELSKLSGVPENTIWGWEKHGIENGTFKNVIKVADALELFMEQLVTDQYDEILMMEEEDEEATA